MAMAQKTAPFVSKSVGHSTVQWTIVHIGQIKYVCGIHVFQPLFIELKAYKVINCGTYTPYCTGCFFHWASPKKTKSKIVLEFPDWASPDPPKKVKVHELGLP